MQWVLLATSLLCRAWKALGAVLLGITADGAGLAEEVSAAELSLRSKQKRKTPVSDKRHRGQGEMPLTASCQGLTATQRDSWKRKGGS